MASALAAGKVLHLDQAQLRGAIGIAAAAAGGLRRNFGVMAKAFQAGNAASQGVQAAMLAATGFTGDPDILEAPLGLFQALQIDQAHAEQTLAKLGVKWELLASLKIKRFPACTPAHQPVQAALQLRRDHGFAPDDVEAIEADLHDQVSLIRLDPADEVAAGFSLPFLLAVALVDGELTLAQVSDGRIHDPKVRQLMSRVHRAGSSTATGAEDAPEQVTIRLRDGRTLTAEAARVDRLDHPTQVEAKFRDCAARTLAPAQIDRLHAAVMSIEHLPNISELSPSSPPSTASSSNPTMPSCSTTPGPSISASCRTTPRPSPKASSSCSTTSPSSGPPKPPPPSPKPSSNPPSPSKRSASASSLCHSERSEESVRPLRLTPASTFA
ncbi:MAG TPA: MmgE/PrpD family protein [Chloroflexota bacterium]